MGQRMLIRQLKREGTVVGKGVHMCTLMRCMGIRAMAPQPGTSKPAPGHKIYPYLLRHAPITAANQVWALDTTYIPMERGFVYLTAVVLGAGCKPSMDGRGAWRDNVFVERLWCTVKYEHVYQRVYASVGQARQQIAEFLQWYNTQRVHSSLQGKTPDEAYWATLPALQKAA